MSSLLLLTLTASLGFASGKQSFWDRVRVFFGGAVAHDSGRLQNSASAITQSAGGRSMKSELRARRRETSIVAQNSEYVRSLAWANSNEENQPLTMLPLNESSRSMLNEEIQQAKSGYQISWTSLGPNPINRTGPAALPVGQVRAILTNPNNPNIVLAGTTLGGIWRSLNASPMSGGLLQDGYIQKKYPTSWAAVGEWAASASITSLTWEAGKEGSVAYAGTGYLVGEGDWGIGAGILKSTDGGISWKPLASTNGPASGELSMWSNVYDIASAIGVNGKTYLFAGTRNGLLRQDVSVGVWEKVNLPGVTNVSEGTAANLECVRSISRDPKNAEHLIVLVSRHSGIYVFEAIDGGVNWRLHSVLNHKYPIDISSTVKQEVRNDVSKVAFLYDASGALQTLMFGVFQVDRLIPSTDSKGNLTYSPKLEQAYYTYRKGAWQPIRGWLDGGGVGLGNEGANHLPAWVNPDAPGHVIIGGQPIYSCQVSFGADYDDVGSRCSPLSGMTLSSGQMHADAYVAVDAVPSLNGHKGVWVGNDGGIALLKLNGGDQGRGYTLSNGMTTGLAYPGDVDDNGNILVGFHDNMAFWMNGQTRAWYSKLAGGDGSTSRIASNGVQFFPSNGGKINISVPGSTVGRVAASYNPAADASVELFKMSPTVFAGFFHHATTRRGEQGFVFDLNLPVDADPPNTKTVFAPIQDCISSVRCVEKIKTCPGDARACGIGHRIADLARFSYLMDAGSPVTFPGGGLAYANDPNVMGDGLLSLDEGWKGKPRLFWTSLEYFGARPVVREVLQGSDFQMPKAACGTQTCYLGGDKPESNYSFPDRINAVALDPHTPGRAYIAYYRMDGKDRQGPMAPIWKTDNYRTDNPEWRPVGWRGTGFPDIKVNHLLVDPEDPRVVFAATQLGLFVSTDAGETWGTKTSSGVYDSYNIGPANVQITHMIIKGRKLYLFTFGRGVWVGDLPRLPRPGDALN